MTFRILVKQKFCVVNLGLARGSRGMQWPETAKTIDFVHNKCHFGRWQCIL